MHLDSPTARKAKLRNRALGTQQTIDGIKYEVVMRGEKKALRRVGFSPTKLGKKQERKVKMAAKKRKETSSSSPSSKKNTEKKAISPNHKFMRSEEFQNWAIKFLGKKLDPNTTSLKTGTKVTKNGITFKLLAKNSKSNYWYQIHFDRQIYDAMKGKKMTSSAINSTPKMKTATVGTKKKTSTKQGVSMTVEKVEGEKITKRIKKEILDQLPDPTTFKGKVKTFMKVKYSIYYNREGKQIWVPAAWLQMQIQKTKTKQTKEKQNSPVMKKKTKEQLPSGQEPKKKSKKLSTPPQSPEEKQRSPRSPFNFKGKDANIGAGIQRASKDGDIFETYIKANGLLGSKNIGRPKKITEMFKTVTKIPNESMPMKKIQKTSMSEYPIKSSKSSILSSFTGKPRNVDPETLNLVERLMQILLVANVGGKYQLLQRFRIMRNAFYPWLQYVRRTKDLTFRDDLNFQVNGIKVYKKRLTATIDKNVSELVFFSVDKCGDPSQIIKTKNNKGEDIVIFQDEDKVLNDACKGVPIAVVNTKDKSFQLHIDLLYVNFPNQIKVSTYILLEMDSDTPIPPEFVTVNNDNPVGVNEENKNTNTNNRINVNNDNPVRVNEENKNTNNRININNLLNPEQEFNPANAFENINPQ